MEYTFYYKCDRNGKYIKSQFCQSIVIRNKWNEINIVELEGSVLKKNEANFNVQVLI